MKSTYVVAVAEQVERTGTFDQNALYPISAMPDFDLGGAPAGAIIGNMLLGAWGLLELDVRAGRLTAAEAHRRFAEYRAVHADVQPSVRAILAQNRPHAEGREARTLATIRGAIYRVYPDAAAAAAVYEKFAVRFGVLTPREQAAGLANPLWIEHAVAAAEADVVRHGKFVAHAESDEQRADRLMASTYPGAVRARVR